jgi:hypothetical protein
LSVAGCCRPSFRLEDAESRRLRTVYDSVDFFRYAVRLERWDVVYEMLSPRSQAWVDEQFGKFAFDNFAAGLKYRRLDKDAPPELADLTISELIHRSQIVSIEPDERSPRSLAHVQLFYKTPSGKLIPPDKTNFPLVNARRPAESYDRWTVGLLEWLEGR